MYPTSTAFRSVVRRSHNVVTKAEIWQSNQKVADLDIVDGTIDVDSRRSVRRTCSVTVISPPPTTTSSPIYNTYADLDALYPGAYSTIASAVSSYGELVVVLGFTIEEIGGSLVPSSIYDTLAPYGNEIRLYRGVVLDDGTEEYVPQGVFLITNVEVEESSNGLRIAVTGVDRSVKISRARWTNTYSITNGTNVADAIAALVADRYPDVQTSFSTTTATVGTTVLGTETDNDPWRDAIKLADSAGMELYFDGDGILVLRSVRDYDSIFSPDAVYRENSEAMILSIRRRITNEQSYNGVVVTAEGTSTDTVFRVEVWDEDPSSPTYRYGNFGQVPLFYSSPLITTEAQATSAATALLAKKKGYVESVDWNQIVDPSLDAADVIAVFNADTRLQRLLVVDRLSIPMSASQPMTATARTVRVLDSESFLEEEDAA